MVAQLYLCQETVQIQDFEDFVRMSDYCYKNIDNVGSQKFSIIFTERSYYLKVLVYAKNNYKHTDGFLEYYFKLGYQPPEYLLHEDELCTIYPEDIEDMYLQIHNHQKVFVNDNFMIQITQTI